MELQSSRQEIPLTELLVQIQKFHFNVPHNALYQNAQKGSIQPNKRAARALEYFQAP